MGYRYRLHRKELPGCPDMVFPRRKKILFVHGCYWHMHDGCNRSFLPKSRIEYWHKKLKKNKKRDEENRKKLEQLGWEVMEVWECETKNFEELKKKIVLFLEH